MSVARVEWIKDFLSLLRPALQSVSSGDIVQLTVDPNAPFHTGFTPEDILIGHELPVWFTETLSQVPITYFDIRISPVRFCAYDNIFAVRTNKPKLHRSLNRYRISDLDLFVEARALSLSFRYRNLGQTGIDNGALVFFTEQDVDKDSIHYKDPVSLRSHVDELSRVSSSYDSLYYVHRGLETDEDPSLLRGLGFLPCSANIYAVLGSPQVRAVAAVRSGVLEEARYFDVHVICLGDPTTPLAADGTGEALNKFCNVLPDDVLSAEFWSEMLCGMDVDAAQAVRRRLLSQNRVRRALNNWNSTATGLAFNSQEWRELVHAPLSGMVERLGDEMEFRQNNCTMPCDSEAYALKGTWRWFTGEVVKIETSGYVRSANDYGLLQRSIDTWTIGWQRRQLIDTISLSPDGSSFTTKNQYGDGGLVWRTA